MTLTGEEKSAVLLNNLAPEIVDKVLARLEPLRRSQLRLHMTRMLSRPESQAIFAGLVDEFDALLRESATEAKAAEARPARTATAPAPAVAPPREVYSRPAPAAPAAPSEFTVVGSDPLAALAVVPADRLAEVLAEEGARTTCVILSLLDTSRASNVYRSLPGQVRNEVSLQFGTTATPSLEILGRVAEALLHKCHKRPPKAPTLEGPLRIRRMADMMRALDKPDRLKVLEALEPSQADLAAEMKNLLYRFDDVLRLDNRSMQKVLMDIDAKSLAIALKDADENIRERFFSNLSKRTQDNLREEMELVQSLPRDQVEQAQQVIVQVVQRLDLAGELTMTD